MYKLVEVVWKDREGMEQWGEAMVEYVELVEDGQVIHEITNVYPPEYAPSHWLASCKEQASADFHAGDVC